MQRIIEAIELVRNKTHENSWLVPALFLSLLIIVFIATSIILLAGG